MGKPIYKMFKGSMTEAWYALSSTEQDALLQKVDAALDEVGGKSVVLCDSRWANEAWIGFGVQEFPNIESAQRHVELLTELNWHRYVATDTLLGTAWEK